MSYCTRCGRTYEDERFKCSYCGAPLAYAPSGKSPSLFSKMMRYRSFLVLIALAVVISMIGFAAQILSMMFWVIFGAIAVGLLYLFLKQRNRRTRYNPPSHKAPSNKNRNSMNSSNQGYGHNKNKASNVIPFKRKRGDKTGKSKNNQNA